MPAGCGPGKYAVAKAMDLSPVQDLPHHLARRSDLSGAPVYDLKFDYDFRRVPRTYGDSQMRIDFSKKKGTGMRWLTDQVKRRRKNVISRKCERTKRDGSKKNGEKHTTKGACLAMNFIADGLAAMSSLVGQPGKANIRATLEANVQVDTSFGITIIVTLGSPLDLSNSYLYFKNKGKINLADHENSRIGVVTIGPNMAVYASADASVTLSRIFNFYNWGGTAQVPIASVPHKQITPNTCVGSMVYAQRCPIKFCDPTIAKFNKDNGAATVNGITIRYNFENDHIFKAGSVPMRYNTGGFDFPLDAQDTSPSNFLANTATKVGGSENSNLMALLYAPTNGVKGTWVGGKKPDWDNMPNTAKEIASAIQISASAFNYLSVLYITAAW
uniref:Uncharacterized protein n=1 Tax=Talaromyces marneffei PM1 TaxID=1077442 RepID=A0A093VQL5_TALMA